MQVQYLYSISLFRQILEPCEDLLHWHFWFRGFLVYRLHMTTRRRRVTLWALFRYANVRFTARGLGVPSVRAGVGVLRGGGIRARRSAFRRIDQRIETGGTTRGWTGFTILTFELEAIEALQVAPVVTHRDRKPRPLHGARGAAVAGGLRERRPPFGWRGRDFDRQGQPCTSRGSLFSCLHLTCADVLPSSATSGSIAATASY